MKNLGCGLDNTLFGAPIETLQDKENMLATKQDCKRDMDETTML